MPPAAIDVIEVLREHLVTVSGLTDIVGTDPGARIFYPILPENAVREAIAFEAVFGETDPITPVGFVDYDFRCYGTDAAGGKGLASTLGLELKDALWNKTSITTASGFINAIEETVPGRAVLDPQTKFWVWIVSYRVHFRMRAT